MSCNYLYHTPDLRADDSRCDGRRVCVSSVSFIGRYVFIEKSYHSTTHMIPPTHSGENQRHLALCLLGNSETCCNHAVSPITLPFPNGHDRHRHTSLQLLHFRRIANPRTISTWKFKIVEDLMIMHSCRKIL